MTKGKPSCAWCGRKIVEFSVARCRKCNLPVCSPMLKDCAYEHWRVRHLGKKPSPPITIETVRTEVV